MPRRRSGFSGSRKRQTRTTTARVPPRQPQTQQRSGGMFSGLMGTIFHGMAFGAGSEVAHNLVGGVMGKGQHQQQETQQTQPTQQTQQQCQLENQNFVDCLKYNSQSIELCQSYLDQLKQCETKPQLKFQQNY